MNELGERDREKERDVLRSIQALRYIVSALPYSQSLHLFIRQNKFAQALSHSLIAHQIIASDFLHVADGCLFLCLLFFSFILLAGLCASFTFSFSRQMCVVVSLRVSSLSHHTIPSQYFPLVLTTQSEIQWAENNLASAHSCVLESRECARIRIIPFAQHQPNRMRRKENAMCLTHTNTTRWILI